MKKQYGSPFFRGIVLWLAGFVFAGALYATLTIPSNINNAVQTISKIVLTPDGTDVKEGNPAILTLDATETTETPLVVRNSIGQTGMTVDTAGNVISFDPTQAPNKIIGAGSASVGGYDNDIQGDSSFSIGSNQSRVKGAQSSIIGGYENTITGEQSFIVGGHQNKISALGSMIISSLQSTINGAKSVVIGGSNNFVSGANSTAGGQNAQALHNNTWVWSDYHDSYDPAEFSSAKPNTFIIRAFNGVGININEPTDNISGKQALTVGGVVGATKYCDVLGNNCILPNNVSPAEKDPTTWGLTAPYLPKWNGTGFVNSRVSDTGARVTIATGLQVNGQIKSPGFWSRGQGVTANGNYATAMGNETQANAESTTAIGDNTRANGFASIAMGYQSIANGRSSVAMGESVQANGTNSIAMGNQTQAIGVTSTSMGYKTLASGANSTAMGNNTQAIGDYSTSMGAGTKAIGNESVAMGGSTEAQGLNSVAMGASTKAIGMGSLAVGFKTIAQGNDSFAIGFQSKATGEYTVAMGSNTQANGQSSTAMGDSTQANGYASIAMGALTKANGSVTTAMGASTEANGAYSTAMGRYSKANGTSSTAIGYSGQANGDYSIAMGVETQANGAYSTSMGYYTIASGPNSIAMGHQTIAVGSFSTAMGFLTRAYGHYSTAMGQSSQANGFYSTAMGYDTEANGTSSIAMGSSTQANGSSSTAMGINTKANGNYTTVMGYSGEANGVASTAIGYEAQAIGDYSFSVGHFTDANGSVSIAMGASTQANGESSIAMGKYATANGSASTAMGDSTEANGWASTAMGRFTKANADLSTAMGVDTQANGIYSTVMGIYNLGFTNSLFEIGNGTDSVNRSNALTVYSDGRVVAPVSIETPKLIVDKLVNRTVTNITVSGQLLPDPQAPATFQTIGSLTSGWKALYAGGITALPNGNVGIGTTNPTTKLEVLGSTLINVGEEENAFVVYNGPDDENAFHVDTDARKISFGPSYEVGIGITNPTEKLEVAGNVLATAYFYSSDITLKKDIHIIDNALDKLNQLNGYSFLWKSNDHKSLGVIAQEVEKVFPELVHVDSNGTKSVEYGNLVAPIIEAIKALTIKIDSLFTRYLSQEARINALEHRLKTLESMK